MKTIGRLLAGLLVSLAVLSFIGCSTDSGGNTWTVTFNTNADGDENAADAVPAAKKVADKSKIDKLPAEPTWENHRFIGWNTEPDGSGEEFTAETIVTASITVYARWIYTNQRVVTFDKNGGDTEADPRIKVVTRNSKVTALPEPPTKADNIFMGWNTKEDGTGDVFDTSTSVADDITVYAQWLSTPPGSLSVTFHKNGGDTEADPKVKVVASSGGTVDALPAPPTRAGGYTFAEWNTKEDGEGDTFDASTPVTESIIVYAKWSAAFTVTFDKNAPAHASATTNASPASMVVTTIGGSVGTLPDSPVYAAAWNGGVTFDGWYTVPDAAGGTEFTGTTPVNGNTTVYARWKFTAGTPTPDGETLVHNTPAITTSGGVLNADGSVTYSDGSIFYKFAENIDDYDNVTAAYIKTGTVRVVTRSYDSSAEYAPSSTSTGGTGIYQTLADSGSITFELKYAIAGGFALQMNNWQQTNDGTVKFTKVTYSKGTRHTITFDTSDVNDSTYVGEELPATYCVNGTRIGLPLPVPNRDGYIFGGWYTDNTFKTAVTSDTIVTTPLNLKAKWNVVVPVTTRTADFTNNITGIGATATVVSASEYSLVWGTATYGSAWAKFKITLDSGASLASYKTITAEIQGTKGDTGYKPIMVLADTSLGTGQAPTGKQICTSSGTNWNYDGGDTWRTMTFTIDKAKAGALSGEIEFSIFVGCAATGTFGGGGATEWHFRNVKINP